MKIDLATATVDEVVQALTRCERDGNANIEAVFDMALLNMAMASSEVQRLQQVRFWKRQDEKGEPK